MNIRAQRTIITLLAASLAIGAAGNAFAQKGSTGGKDGRDSSDGEGGSGIGMPLMLEPLNRAPDRPTFPPRPPRVYYSVSEQGHCDYWYRQINMNNVLESTERYRQCLKEKN